MPALPVDFAVVMLGTNDAAYQVGPADFRTSLDALVGGMLQANGAEHVILMTPPPRPLDAGGSLGTTIRLQWYRQAMLDICSQLVRTICIDIYAIMDAAQPYYFAPGDLHPNAVSHEMIARQIELRVVPEPGMLVLLASGLVGLAMLNSRR